MGVWRIRVRGQVMSKGGLIVATLLILILMGALFGFLHEVSKTSDCRELCTERRSMVMGPVCYCATPTGGWEPG